MKDENSEDQDRSGGINLDILIHSEDAFPRTMLVMPFTDMISEGFPVPPHDFSRRTGMLYYRLTYNTLLKEFFRIF